MFDDALLESRKDHTLGGRRLSLPVAIALHAAVIGSFVGASAWITGEAPDPVIPIVYPVTSGPNLLPDSNGGERRVRHGTPGVSHGPAPVALMPIRDVATTFVDAIDAAESPGETTEPPGDGAGDSNGGGESTGPPSGGGGTGRSGDSIFRPGGDVREPALLRRVEPDYPEAARRVHLQGTVILEAVITAAGDVQQIRVLKSLNSILDEAAVRAVSRWQYRPATLNGRAVAVYLTVTVTFGLDG